MISKFKEVFNECVKEIPMNYGHFGYYKAKKLPIRMRKIIKKEARIRNDYIQNILPDQILEEKNKIDFSFNHNDEIESSKPFIIENLNNHNSYLSENKYFTFLNIKLNLVEKFYKESFIKLDDICKNQVNQSESKNYRFFPIVKNNVASIIVDKYHNYMTAPLKKDNESIKEYIFSDHTFCNGYSHKYNFKDLEAELKNNTFNVNIELGYLNYNKEKRWCNLYSRISSFNIKDSLKAEMDTIIKTLINDNNNKLAVIPLDVKEYIYRIYKEQKT